jgi:hypothetical protein
MSGWLSRGVVEAVAGAGKRDSDEQADSAQSKLQVCKGQSAISWVDQKVQFPN